MSAEMETLVSPEVIEGPGLIPTPGEIVPPVVSPEHPLLQKTVCLMVQIRIPGNSRKLPSQSDVIQTEVDRDRLGIQKKLLKCPEYEVIRKFDSKLRGYIELVTLPGFLKRGFYTLPVTLIKEFHAKLAAKETERNALIDAFLAVYEEAIAQAQIDLKGAFNASDYPPPEEMRKLFSIETRMFKPVIDDKIEEVDKEIYQQELAKQVHQLDGTWEEIREGLRIYFKTLITHLVDRLTPDGNGKIKVFKDTTITGFQDWLAYFDHKNIHSDAELKEQVDRVRELILGTNAQVLRKDKSFRETVLGEAQKAAVVMSTLITTKTRKFGATEEF